MPYITYYKNEKEKWQQLTMEDILNNNYRTPSNDHLNEFVTFYTDEYTFTTLQATQWIATMSNLITCMTPFVGCTDMSQYYDHFKIPKKSGGYRDINAPQPLLKTTQTRIKDALLNEFKILPHNASYAYVKGRSIKNALEVHQKNDSKYFLKIDLKDFFPSHTPEYIFRTLSKIYPMNKMCEEYPDTIKDIINVCCLNGGLPQGSPVSPTLTNILMVPIDFHIQNRLNKYGQRINNEFAYTRYADDIIISAKKDFNWKTLIKGIKSTFDYFEAPFTINDQKTRYGSANGKNWNLGLMYNGNGDITIGHKKKQIFRAKLFNYCQTYQNWSTLEKQQLSGLISYYRMIEEDYIMAQINKYSAKYNLDIMKSLKDFS